MRIQIKEALKCKNRENGIAEKTQGTEIIGDQDCGRKETQKSNMSKGMSLQGKHWIAIAMGRQDCRK